MKQSGFYKISQRYVYLVQDIGGTYSDNKERPVYCCIQDKDNPQNILGDTTMHSLTTKGIIVNGASGTGKTTLGRALAKQLGFPHLDLDDYYYPSQDEVGSYRFAELRPRNKIIEHLKNDLSKHPYFVMSGTIGSILWDFVNPLFDLAVLLFVPTETRLERVKARAFERYGERVLEGGDLYNNHQEFYNHIQQYDIGYHSVSLQRHEQWAKEIHCPVIRVDGTRAIIENSMLIAEQYQSIQHSD